MRTLQLTQIEFSNASKKVRCQGKMKEEHLQFDSNLIIDFSQLNYLMNQLTKKFGSDIIYDSIVTTQDPEGELFTLNLEKFDIDPVPLSELTQGFKSTWRISA